MLDLEVRRIYAIIDGMLLVWEDRDRAIVVSQQKLSFKVFYAQKFRT